jgi:riboflavin transporter FmnP
MRVHALGFCRGRILLHKTRNCGAILRRKEFLMQQMKQTTKLDLRTLVMTAMLAAVSTVLMFFSFNVPLMPGFIKMDFSELPALIASFALGPISGVAVCLVKNLVNLFFTATGGIGELSNFILGALFVFPAGLIYQKLKGRKGALIGSLVGALSMAVLSVFTNYYIVYPAYAEMIVPLEAIMGMYQAINPNVETLWQALWVFNVPFTFIKGMCSVVITFLTYKKLSPLIKGK